MSRRLGRTRFLIFVGIALVICGCFGRKKLDGTDSDRTALEKTSEGILAAFARGDVDGIMAYHHPDVVKSLSYGKFLSGRDTVRKDIAETLGRFHLEWKENRVRSLKIQGNTAIEISDFTIKGTPIQQGEPFLFRGRALVVYVRYKDSPSGWASFREMIQPAN